MKYLLVSDIHGSWLTLKKVLLHFDNMHCDILCILGDIINYGPRNGVPEGLNPKEIAEKLNAMADKIIAIRGNCDSEVDQMLLDFPIMQDYMLLVDEGHKLLLTHGHIYNKVTPALLPFQKEEIRQHLPLMSMAYSPYSHSMASH